MNPLNEELLACLIKLRTDLAYAAPELWEEKFEKCARKLTRIGDVCYESMGPAASEILETELGITAD
jgi:hypothetical protein